MSGWYTLRHNARTASIPNLLVLDTEAHIEHVSPARQIQRLRLAVCCHYQPPRTSHPERREYITTSDPDELWRWVSAHCEPDRSNLLIAHNASYDMRIACVSRLLHYGWRAERCVIDDQPFILSFSRDVGRRSKQRLHIISTTNIVKASLSSLGELVGVPKLSVDFSTCSDDELAVYCKRDVDVLLTWFLHYVKWLSDNDLGMLAYTAPSQAMHAYRHRFLTHQIVYHNDDVVKALERRSYYGGRCECGYIGTLRNGPYYQVDINSMYPYVMRTHEYPTKLLHHTTQTDVAHLRRALMHYCVTADVTVATDEPAYPHRQGALLTFPVGTFRTVLSTPELQYALSHGHIQAIHEMAIYSKAPIFVSFVDWFYAYRLSCRAKGDVIGEQFAKLLMNSLYGKFGQYSEEWELVSETDPDRLETYVIDDYDDGTSSRYRAVLGRLERLLGRVERASSYPAIAAHVTAYARMYLYSLIKKAGVEHVYYMDTDSLIVDREGYDRLETDINQTELGKLKVENVSDMLTILGSKHYRMGTKERRKGIRKDAKLLEDGRYEQEQWHSYRWNIRNGVSDAVVIDRIIKRGSSDYRKGTVQRDGRVVQLRMPT